MNIQCFAKGSGKEEEESEVSEVDGLWQMQALSSDISAFYKKQKSMTAWRDLFLAWDISVYNRQFVHLSDPLLPPAKNRPLTAPPPRETCFPPPPPWCLGPTVLRCTASERNSLRSGYLSTPSLALHILKPSLPFRHDGLV